MTKLVAHPAARHRLVGKSPTGCTRPTPLPHPKPAGTIESLRSCPSGCRPRSHTSTRYLSPRPPILSRPPLYTTEAPPADRVSPCRCPRCSRCRAIPARARNLERQPDAASAAPPLRHSSAERPRDKQARAAFPPRDRRPRPWPRAPATASSVTARALSSTSYSLAASGRFVRRNRLWDRRRWTNRP